MNNNIQCDHIKTQKDKETKRCDRGSDKQKPKFEDQWREAMVQWLRQMAHDQEVMGSNPGAVYWMDVSDLLAITLKKN